MLSALEKTAILSRQRYTKKSNELNDPGVGWSGSFGGGEDR